MDFVTTGDGSKTLYHAEVGECYHSKHGAHRESIHVFVNSGMRFYLEKENQSRVSILEVGFGTGLNFLVTADYCLQHDVSLDYCSIEAFPLPAAIIRDTGYEAYVPSEVWQQFLHTYDIALREPIIFIPKIRLEIAATKVLEFDSENRYDVIYFDAFAAVHQPEMWTEETLAHVSQFLKPGGVFVTYAITGQLKRTMKTLGFDIEKAPGAPGKREMLRAIKK